MVTFYTVIVINSESSIHHVQFMKNINKRDEAAVEEYRQVGMSKN
jgi:hypothetical protein